MIATAFETDDCAGMVGTFAQHYLGFPEIAPGTQEELGAWRASQATEPLNGLGNVFALCQADLPDGGHVFYWRKTPVDAETTGYTICDCP